ncbi:hypothetical protein Tco_1408203 [Tanacetum coccineum]
MLEGTLLADMRDRWTWSLEGSGEFSVASVRKLLDDKMLPEVASTTRSIKAMPITAAESSRHIFFICRITREVLSKISRWWDVSYSDSSSYEVRVGIKEDENGGGAVERRRWWSSDGGDGLMK